MKKQELEQHAKTQEKTIEILRASIESHKKTAQKYNEKERDYIKEIKVLQKQIIMLHHQNISDLQSFTNYLIPFDSEQMTHREKSYMSRKINSILSKVIEKRMQSIDSIYESYNENLPF
jgi:uncharacterized coiled-coil protein SlyX